MNSMSFEMLRFADKMPRCDESEDDHGSVDEGSNCSPDRWRPQHEDYIPTEVRRHIAAYLSSLAKPALSPSTLLAQINSNAYVNQRAKLLWRTLLPGSPSDFTQSTSGLLDLPPELYGVMSDHLDPADMICLGLTCKQLFLAADYHLVDLKNLEYSGGELGRLLWDHQLYCHLATERHSVKQRLRRDRVAYLSQQETHNRLVCSACIRLHPTRFFSSSQRRVSGTDRKCLASTAPLRICPHWTESHGALVARAERSACDPVYRDVYRTQTCDHDAHLYGVWSAPSMLDLHGTYSIERSVTLGDCDDRNSITAASIREILTSVRFRDVRICAHVVLGSEVVVRSFRRMTRPRLGVLEDLPDEESVAGECLPEFEPASCAECSTIWQFAILDFGGGRYARPRWRVSLIVDDQVRIGRDPWEVEYLRRVENGAGLMRLLEEDG